MEVEGAVSDLIKSSSPAGFSPLVPATSSSFSAVRSERKEKERKIKLELN